MEDILKNLSIDKSSWKQVRFGDIVAEPKESVKDSIAAGIEHVVGLEHIDSENIHLCRSAGIDQSTTFTKKFSAGDVLFGRRRAYLKKAAQASFDGICSGDITVMRIKEGLLPALLPFVVQNEKFFDYAIKHSAGGLSPRVKFKDLANYEFLLPPKEQQAQLAELLWALDEVIEKDKNIQCKYGILNECVFNDLLKGIGTDTKHTEFKKTIVGEIPTAWDIVKLENLCLNIGDGIHKTPKYILESQYYFVNGNNLIKNRIKIFEKTKCVSKEEFDKYNKNLDYGSVLMSINGTIGNLAFYRNEAVILGKSIAYITPDEKKLNSKFLFYLLQSNSIKTYSQRELTGSTIANLSLKSIRNTPVALPSLTEQIEIANRAIFMDILKRKIIEKHSTSNALQKSLINQVF